MHNKTLSIAPMLDWTDRHFRMLMRLITKKTWLYTEMLTIKEVLEKGEALAPDPLEHPIAIQFGGSHPQLLKRCAELAGALGYDEVNLNVGCPSSRVQQGGIGACLMLNPQLVAECVEAMNSVTRAPVTVKCRLGVDDKDTYEDLVDFIATVSRAGCQKFILHARKAWLKGLSPKQNREIPPLDYERVSRIKSCFPALEIILNGGVKDLVQAENHLEEFDGVMIGRAAYENPFMFAEVDEFFFQAPIPKNEQDIVQAYMKYVEIELQKGTRLQALIRPLLGMFYRKSRAKYWRQHLSSHSHVKGAGLEVISEALNRMNPALT